MTIDELLNSGLQPEAIMAALKEKTNHVPVWGGDGLVSEYDPKKHPVMNKALLPDAVTSTGVLEPVTRVSLNWQKLAAKRMTELVCGIPIKRAYTPENDKQKEVARLMEAIYTRCRIDSMNVERLHQLFAGCEVMTLWYAVEDRNNVYGVNSKIKMRCRNLSPMNGDHLYPLWDEYGDLVALSVEYTRKINGTTVTYFDCYTQDRHIKWSNESNSYGVVEDEEIAIQKIPAVYMWRPTPIWEDTSSIVYDIEWQLSRNGIYLRKNSKPKFVVFADEQISYGDEGGPNEDLGVLQYPTGAKAEYITWAQATDNLKFHVNELRNSFFTQLQLPDWSYEKMSQQAMSGESRKQLFIDSQLKVKDESGIILEFYDREVNVVKAFVKAILGDGYANDIDALKVENIITPFSITDDKDTINNLMAANGGKPIITQRESISLLGWSQDVDKTLEELKDESTNDIFNQYE